MSDGEEQRRGRATVAVYDRPRWWRTRRVWKLALPIVVAVASLVLWYVVLA
jgi:hypothetical protein